MDKPARTDPECFTYHIGGEVEYVVKIMCSAVRRCDYSVSYSQLNLSTINIACSSLFILLIPRTNKLQRCWNCLV